EDRSEAYAAYAAARTAAPTKQMGPSRRPSRAERKRKGPALAGPFRVSRLFPLHRLGWTVRVARLAATTSARTAATWAPAPRPAAAAPAAARPRSLRVRDL